MQEKRYHVVWKAFDVKILGTDRKTSFSIAVPYCRICPAVSFLGCIPVILFESLIPNRFSRFLLYCFCYFTAYFLANYLLYRFLSVQNQRNALEKYIEIPDD